MLLSLLLSLSVCTADTLVVETAQMEELGVISRPYQTDSIDVQGRSFDIQEVFGRNSSLVSPTKARSVAKTAVQRGEALAVSADSLPVFRQLHFSLQTPRYLTGRIEVSKLKNYKLFVDGVENYGSFSLTPGRSQVVLQVLSQKENNDTFDVKIIGDSLAGLVVNADGKRPYTMKDMVQGDHYYQVALSPSGKYLATVSYFTRPDGYAQYSTALTELSTGRELLRRNEYLSLSWLRGSNDVLYYTRSGGLGKELVLFTPADGKEKILADHLPEGSFSVSPNEDYLIFSLSEEGKGAKDGLKKLQEPDDRMPGWRSRTSLWRYDLRTGAMQRLTFGKTSVYLSDISADGRNLLLQYSHFNAARQPFDRSGFLRMDAYSGKVDTLLTDTAFVAGAKFSPDGKQLLISASPAAFGGIGCEVKAGQHPNSFDYRLYLYDLASRTVTPLLRNFAPAVDNYQWSPGDGMIYFTATDRAYRSVFRLDPRTQRVLRYELPVTNVQGFTLATQARTAPRAVFFGQSAERAREMFTCELGKKQPAAKRIGTIDFDKLYADVAIGTCHEWKFQASRGDSIDGFYFLPPDFDASKRYPLIVYYYGGCTPTSQCLEYQYPLQVLAGQGYVVYALNPSGAIGYGQEFAARHVNTWGHESGDDIIEGVKQFCREHAFIDASRIGCMGASYGGFMTEYLQTRTDIFAAAVSHAGISNIASYWGGGYWGYSYGETAQYGSFPWNNPKLYVEQSALFNADKIHTPLLLLHGTADTNVPTNESQQLYTALKILGRDVAYIQVEGENHVIQDFKKRMAWQNAIFAWFAKYLKKDAAWWDALEL